MVEEGRNVDAYRLFYTDDTVGQDNSSPERIGLEANVTRQAAALEGVAEVHENRAASVLVDGDRVVINWVFRATLKDGRRLHMDELALQTWRGDRIAHERFYYDPAALGADPV